MTRSPVFLGHVEHRYFQHHFSCTALYVRENYPTLDLELRMSSMSLIYRCQVGWGFEQPDLLKMSLPMAGKVD